MTNLFDYQANYPIKEMRKRRDAWVPNDRVYQALTVLLPSNRDVIILHAILNQAKNYQNLKSCITFSQADFEKATIAYANEVNQYCGRPAPFLHSRPLATYLPSSMLEKIDETQIIRELNYRLGVRGQKFVGYQRKGTHTVDAIASDTSKVREFLSRFHLTFKTIRHDNKSACLLEDINGPDTAQQLWDTLVSTTPRV